MIDRIVQWFRDFYGLDLNDEMKAMAQPAALAHEAHRDQLSMTLSRPPYEDRGVYYFYAKPGSPSEKMARLYLGKALKAFKGTYRFDSSSGTYYFSKQDKGTAVVIVFTEHGQLKRKSVTI